MTGVPAKIPISAAASSGRKDSFILVSSLWTWNTYSEILTRRFFSDNVRSLQFVS
jgi:hypothetical protein